MNLDIDDLEPLPVSVLRSRAVIGSRLSLTLQPDFLQPEVRECRLLDQLVTW